MNSEDQIDRLLRSAKSKSDLHRAIDALPENATLLLVADACCCGDPEHGAAAEGVVYHAVFGNPSLSGAIGLLNLAEHALIGEASMPK